VALMRVVQRHTLAIVTCSWRPFVQAGITMR
jgi:hypothetical protein